MMMSPQGVNMSQMSHMSGEPRAVNPSELNNRAA